MSSNMVLESAIWRSSVCMRAVTRITLFQLGSNTSIHPSAQGWEEALALHGANKIQQPLKQQAHSSIPLLGRLLRIDKGLEGTKQKKNKNYHHPTLCRTRRRFQKRILFLCVVCMCVCVLFLAFIVPPHFRLCRVSAFRLLRYSQIASAW